MNTTITFKPQVMEMENMELVVYISLLILILFIFSTSFLFRGRKYSNRLPPGSLGLPLIGQTFQAQKAIKEDRLKEWFEERISKYGPVSKAHLFGNPSVLLHGPAANKFLHTSAENVLIATQPQPLRRILGQKNITETRGPDHKKLRGALVSFLKVEVLKQQVAKLDEQVQHLLQIHVHGKHELQVQPLVKTMTFNLISALLFGIEEGPKRDRIMPLLGRMFKGVLSVPINLPFTQFNRGLTAKKKLLPMILDLIAEKDEQLKKNQADTHQDLITHFLSIRDDKDSTTMITDEEIIDVTIGVMAAGYDSTANVITFLIKILATNKSVYSTVLQEHEEIANSKEPGEALTWEDLSHMEYTWKVASEILRMHPQVAMVVRRANKDIEYEGFIIPKGWQVIVSSTMTHTDNKNFSNPTVFDPNRFNNKPPSFTYIPFGGGARLCPGIELSRIETLIIIHRLVMHFKWELVNKDESFKRVPMTTFDQGLLVRIKPIK